MTPGRLCQSRAAERSCLVRLDERHVGRPAQRPVDANRPVPGKHLADSAAGDSLTSPREAIATRDARAGIMNIALAGFDIFTRVGAVG